MTFLLKDRSWQAMAPSLTCDAWVKRFNPDQAGQSKSETLTRRLDSWNCGWVGTPANLTWKSIEKTNQETKNSGWRSKQKYFFLIGWCHWAALDLVESTWAPCQLPGSGRTLVWVWRRRRTGWVFWVQVWLLGDFSQVWKLLADKDALLHTKINHKHVKKIK